MVKSFLTGSALLLALGVAACDNSDQQASDPAVRQEQQATTPGSASGSASGSATTGAPAGSSSQSPAESPPGAAPPPAPPAGTTR